MRNETPFLFPSPAGAVEHPDTFVTDVADAADASPGCVSR
jgi:hypothetical protein